MAAIEDDKKQEVGDEGRCGDEDIGSPKSFEFDGAPHGGEIGIDTRCHILEIF
jgi:hypothetical protein